MSVNECEWELMHLKGARLKIGKIESKEDEYTYYYN